MRQTVVLLHTLPDGSSHHDWLIDQPHIAHEKRLLSFRCPARPDLATEPFSALALPPHRARYLRYQGPIAQNLGCVTRVAVGRVLSLDPADTGIILSVQWVARLVRYTAVLTPPSDPLGHPQWRFRPIERP